MKNEAGLASRRMAGHGIGDKGRFPNFFSRNFPLGRGILDDYEEVGIFDTDELGGNHNWGTEKRRGKSLFILGPPGAGTGFHSHSAAYNVLLFGVKRWYLLPPHAPFFWDRDKELPWFEVLTDEKLGKLPIRPIIFDQYPGETIYVPSQWKHATVNLDVCVGLAVEMGDESYKQREIL